MKTRIRHFNLLEEDQILEHIGLIVIVPDTILETNFIIDWIRHELIEDLGDINGDYDLLGKFNRACDKLRYYGNGMVLFDPTSQKKKADATDILFYVHQYKEMEDSEHADYQPMRFELIWEQGRVAQTLFEASIVDRLIKEIV